LQLKLFGSGFQLYRLDLSAILLEEQVRHEGLRLGILPDFNTIDEKLALGIPWSRIQ